MSLTVLFQVNLEGDKVRRQLPIGDVPNDVDGRTVYVVKHVFLNDISLLSLTILLDDKTIPFCPFCS